MTMIGATITTISVESLELESVSTLVGVVVVGTLVLVVLVIVLGWVLPIVVLAATVVAVVPGVAVMLEVLPKELLTT